MRSSTRLACLGGALPALTLTLALAVGGAQAHQSAATSGADTSALDQPDPALAAQGQRHFQHYCQPCHAPQDGSVRKGPDLTGLYQRRFTPAMKRPVNDANLGGHIKQGGPRMPPFPWLSQGDLEALLAYLKTL